MAATDGKQLLRLATAGSVDDGKSTLIGRMLLDAKLLFDDTHLAVILIDARNGIIEQSRRHATPSSLLGIRHLVAAVNKMDLVDWSEERFREIDHEFRSLAERLGVEHAHAIPIS